MEYFSGLIFILMMVVAEVSQDQLIQSSALTDGQKSKIMHSVWQLMMRGVLILGIIWYNVGGEAFPGMGTHLAVVLSTYILWYWSAFDSIYAAGVLKQKPWYLGSNSWLDKKMGINKKFHFILFIVKWALAIAMTVLMINL